ncbi:hypothetical protein BCON_0021g00750 [Botryotinia convoluta]|uniref:Carboxylic ester hydrolase n=1 Tax=Botryotinia convoluta TaxID=54673 RepID=A0A4Z1IRY7_9HELO|nr:hypothetical protein BCON_0021g00750 [Botryotinia convoluta]
MPAGVSLSFATPVAENSAYIVPEGDTGWLVNPINSPKLCAIGATVPFDQSNKTFGFGLFLPDKWNGRTLHILSLGQSDSLPRHITIILTKFYSTVGNGGLAGGVNWADMGTGVKYGHAAISTDTGHNSTSTDASRSYENKDGQTNWGWRALHESVVFGKNITEAYYQTAPSYNYYQDCSTGGRQGFKNAQIFPEDFDGVIAGASAWWTSHQQIWQFWLGYINYISNVTMIPTSMFDVIGREVLRQCDGQDGLVDTIISDPNGCNFDASALLCAQNVTNGTTAGFFPHCLLGAEPFWTMNIDGGSPKIIGLGYIQYTLGLGPHWNWQDFDADVVALPEKLNAGQSDASDYDMSPFYDAGKKFIHYHGMSDGGISTGASFYLYDQIDHALTSQGIELGDFYRFFPIPGMGHCTDTADYVNAPYYIASINMTNNGQYSIPGY